MQVLSLGFSGMLPYDTFAAPSQRGHVNSIMLSIIWRACPLKPFDLTRIIPWGPLTHVECLLPYSGQLPFIPTLKITQALGKRPPALATWEERCSTGIQKHTSSGLEILPKNKTEPESQAKAGLQHARQENKQKKNIRAWELRVEAKEVWPTRK